MFGPPCQPPISKSQPKTKERTTTMGMDKKAKKRVEVLRQRIQKLKQQLSGAKQQDDEPGEVERLEKEISDSQKEIENLKAT